ncbi:MAG: hypothetical protein AAB920_00150, partial [Patescibacteria group bacterium]
MKQETLETVGKERSTKGITIVTVAFLVGLGLGWFVFGYVLPARNEKIDDSLGPLVLAGQNIIAIDDQLFGDGVTVKSINLTADSWVAIHEDIGGKPGNILGAAWFPQGVSSGAVELQRPT